MITSPFGKEFAFVVVSSKDESNYALHPAEREILSPNATSKRCREFAMGRMAANTALKQLGYSQPPPILKSPSRAPIWPEGIIGSITHCSDFAIVALAKSDVANGIGGIGIDLQKLDGNCSQRIVKRICTESELKWVRSCSNEIADKGIFLFSAKESVFKAFHPLCQCPIGFTDVELSYIHSNSKHTFEGKLLTDLSDAYKAQFRFNVGIEIMNDFVFTYVLL